MSRIDSLLSLRDKLIQKNIHIIFVQICEAHSVEWPIGNNVDYITPHKTLDERFDRADIFVQKYFNNNDIPINEYGPFHLLVDTFDDIFESTFQAWPDKFYLLDKEKRLISTSTYGAKKDALIDKDYLEILLEMTG